MGGRAQLFKLLGGEDVDGNQVDLGVSVLAGLRGGHLDNLAGTVLNHNEAVLPQSRALHGVRLGGTGIGALKGVLMLDTSMLVFAVHEGRKMAESTTAPRLRGDGDSRRWGKRAHAEARPRGTYLRVVGHFENECRMRREGIGW